MIKIVTQDEFVPDRVVIKEFGITRMTLNRWDRDEELKFPLKVKINDRNFRRRVDIDAFKQRMLEQAIAARSERKKACSE